MFLLDWGGSDNFLRLGLGLGGINTKRFLFSCFSLNLNTYLKMCLIKKYIKLIIFSIFQ